MVTHLAWRHRPGLLPEQAVVQTRMPGRYEAVIRPTLVGPCGTDRGIVMGTYPGTQGVVLGHEGIGVVEQVGQDVAAPVPGQRVVVNPTLWCDQCAECRRGRTNCCQEKARWEIGVSLDGLLQQSCVAPARALHLVPDDLPDHAAVMIEPLACVLHALSRVDFRSVRDALVVGGGPIGSASLWTFTRRPGRHTASPAARSPTSSGCHAPKTTSNSSPATHAAEADAASTHKARDMFIAQRRPTRPGCHLRPVSDRPGRRPMVAATVK